MFIQKPCILIGLLIWALLFTKINSITFAQAQSKCESEMAEAERQYVHGQIEESIQSLNLCLNQNAFTEKNEIRAYRLLGLNYIAKNDLDQAKNAIRKLLELTPDYEPDSVQDPPQFISLIKSIQQEMGIHPLPNSKTTSFAYKIGNWFLKKWQLVFITICLSLLFVWVKISRNSSSKPIDSVPKHPVVDSPNKASKIFAGEISQKDENLKSAGITEIEKATGLSGFYNNSVFSRSQIYSEGAINFNKFVNNLKFYRELLNREYDALSQQANSTYRLWVACMSIGFLTLIGSIVTMIAGYITQGILSTVGTSIIYFIQRLFREREDHYRSLAMKKFKYLEHGNDLLNAIQVIDSTENPASKRTQQAKLFRVLTKKLEAYNADEPQPKKTK